jgi:hypothetical protein
VAVTVALPGRTVALHDVAVECIRADGLHGPQTTMPDGTHLPGDRLAELLARARMDTAVRLQRPTWRLVLAEEVAEAFAETDPARLREELIQVAATAVRWVEAIDAARRP